VFVYSLLTALLRGLCVGVVCVICCLVTRDIEDTLCLSDITHVVRVAIWKTVRCWMTTIQVFVANQSTVG